jgi:SAM-dependent methyltransferase
MSRSPKNIPDEVGDDYLWRNLRDLPYFRALLRAIEARSYKEIELPPPTLDLGCGDGHFASITFDRKLEVGIDPWWSPILEAQGRQAYIDLAQSDGARQPFPNAYFGSVVSNSVLEHIPHVDEVLLEVKRVTKSGGLFIFCVPNNLFLPELSVGRVLDKFGLVPLGDIYRSFFNRISRHYHCDPPEIWIPRLDKAGFEVERWWHYFSPSALKTLEWGHYLGIPSLVTKALTGRWILSPTSWNLMITHQLVRKIYNEADEQENGVYTFYIAKRL